MGDHDDGQVQLLIDVLQQGQDGFRGLRVQGARRFVGQKHLRVRSQGAGDADALFLAAGELARIVVFALVELDQFQQFVHAAPDLVFGHALDFQGEGHILFDRAAGQQVEVLEDHADVLAGLAQFRAVQGRHFLAVDEDLAARGHLEHVDAADEGRFAGAGQADDAEDLAVFDFEVRLLQGLDVAGFAVVCFFYVDQFDHMWFASARPCGRGASLLSARWR